MPALCFSDDAFFLPPADSADEEGLVLIGGVPTPSRVLEAYAKGIFPWYENDGLPLWFSPDPRFVLFPEELHVRRSMQKLMAKGTFTYRTDTAFAQVIGACAETQRKGQSGTWITPTMRAVYTQLHLEGFAHSGECWNDGRLVGGVYGIRLGGVFFGESMFSHKSNASKFAFVRLVQELAADGVSLVDCQVYTEHVESLGARLIPRGTYLEMLADRLPKRKKNTD